MAQGTKEKDFEAQIERYLVERGGYTAIAPQQYHKELCLLPAELLGFIKETQAKAYSALQQQYGVQTDQRIVENIARNIKANGLVEVLRKGVKDRGQLLRLCFFRPVNAKNKEHFEAYSKNRFAVVRQLQYSKLNTNEIDLVLFLNGIPLLTAELKNALTGQYVTDAIKQYKKDRDPKESLLSYKRCLVHFAVSTEKIYMTTQLKGDKTFFLPFNKGIENPNVSDDFKTDYLWKEIWEKESLLDIIQNYVNEQEESEKYYDEKARKVKEKKSKKMIFPRFHQLRAVRRLTKALHQDGVGENYLVQHSAGSGKSNTITWLAYLLAGFYQNPEDEKRLFDCIIIVTDRKALDRQLQNNILQFEQVPGVVVAIDDKKTSQDLRNAIEQGKTIIITTLQKFPVISEAVTRFQDRNYAVMIDEAHSSQSGESARHLRKSLSLEQAEVEDEENMTLDDVILDEISQRGRQRNISFFAFTATPKTKTIQLFGTSREGNKEAFDVYSMEQAIKEGFIKDVLKNYTSFKRYYRLAKRSNIEDKEYETKKTVRLLNSYVDLHDNAIELKSRIMLEHFVSQTQKEIQGKARAILVTRSRLHAVRYKRKFDELMQEMKLSYGALVAFSGSVYDEQTDDEYTESSMNNLGGRISIPDALKMPQYRILIVANKYQTGFDEPLLQTMFVDKKLGNVNTVQTLSRLNRSTDGKLETMVLDFVNDPNQIREDFQEYYGKNYMQEEHQTDPNSLYDLQNVLDHHPVFTADDLNAYATILFKEKDSMELLQPILNNCSDRYYHLDEDAQIEFRAAARDFVRLYRFLSQIITFQDVELEKYYVFLLGLIKKLPAHQNELPKEVLAEVELESYKVQKEYTTSLSLVEEDQEMYGLTFGGNGKDNNDYDLLSNIIKVLNETYGLNLSEEDKRDFSNIKQQINSNESLKGFFNKANSKDDIREKFDEEIDDALLQFVNTKLELYNKLTEDKANSTLKRLWFNDLYDRLVRGIAR